MKWIVLTSVLALSACGPDKFLHAGAGIGIGLVSDEVLGDYGCELAIAAGIAKELIDPVFSLPDVLATSVYCLRPLLEKTK